MKTPSNIRFERHYIPEPNSGCWLWTGAVMKNGYGVFQDHGYGSNLAHRYSYRAFKGHIPEGLDIDHLCRVRSCVNPDHLEPVTRKENLLRSPLCNGGKTHCKYGHELNQENTWIEKDGRRHCRTCHKLRERKRRHALAI